MKIQLGVCARVCMWVVYAPVWRERERGKDYRIEDTDLESEFLLKFSFFDCRHPIVFYFVIQV